MPETQLIRLILHDGDPDGLRTALIAGRTTTVTAVPWVRQKELFARAEAQRPGVYVLVGEPLGDAETDLDEVAYIGECDSLASRFAARHHQSEGAEWSQMFFATTTDGTFNKAHARAAEDQLVRRARDSGRAHLLNGSTSVGRLDEGDAAVARDFAANVLLLVQTLGLVMFREPSKVARLLLSTAEPGRLPATISGPTSISPGVGEVFVYSINRARARMTPVGSEFLILPASTIVEQSSESLGAVPRRLRHQALESGNLINNGTPGLLTLQQSVATRSVSAAAQFISGNSVNGMLMWTHETTGQSYAAWSANLGISIGRQLS